MKRFFKWLFWIIVCIAAIIGAWFAFDVYRANETSLEVVETTDSTEIVEIIDTLKLNTVEANE